MKYKLINIKTKEETLCEKVTSEGYDYYVNNTNKVQIASMSVLDFTVATTNPNSDLPKVFEEFNLDKQLGEWKYKLGLKEAKEKADEKFENGYAVNSVTHKISHRFGYVYGIKEAEKRLVPIIIELKSQSTHQFTEQDMIEFTEWAVTEFRRSFPVGVQETAWFPIQAFKGIYERRMHTTKELLQIWKDEQTKIIYYE